MSTGQAAPGVCSVGIRLQGVMQSWAMIGRGAIRSTHTRPTKSGVIGLIANALGRDWSDDISDLAQLRFGVRVDAPGTLEVDYHTTGGGGRYYALPREVAYAPAWWGDARTGDPSEPDWLTYAPPRDIAEGPNGGLTSSKANASITSDQYLADADFLAAVQGSDPELMHAIAAALAAPARALFLGRKAYGPSAPLLEALTYAPIEDLFANHPVTLRITETGARQAPVVDVYVEPLPGEPGQVVHDQPVTFDGPTRRGARLETHYVLDTATPPALTPAVVPAQASTAGGTSLFDDVFDEGTTP
ncbi:CRISPR-associated protein Cas5 [Mycolicibacterium llatzerense]|uniref:CRISPR-associated protein Cas5 n=1 Tax=Mycolicibacterium llatzerense TaxID=280871 RepID=UPI0021B5F30D|nr:CRISPR-associated protein Cas5 [Mycolicibacterium llatzerense]MCT7372660.1 hypothetical protein [Mycolicibacterium llatzerense]